MIRRFRKPKTRADLSEALNKSIDAWNVVRRAMGAAQIKPALDRTRGLLDTIRVSLILSVMAHLRLTAKLHRSRRAAIEIMFNWKSRVLASAGFSSKGWIESRRVPFVSAHLT